MSALTIAIEVDPKTAAAYKAASLEKRRKVDTLISFQLRRAMRSNRALDEIMDSMSQTAKERGLTPEILEQLLSES